MPLAERYFHKGSWEKLEPILDMLAGKRDLAAAKGLGELELLFRAGRCALELGKPDKAVYYLHQAIDLEPMHLPALFQAGCAYKKLERWSAARDLFDRVLVIQRANNVPEERLAETLEAIADTWRGQGDADRAIEIYRRSLEYGFVRSAHASLCQLYEERRDYHRVVDTHTEYLAHLPAGEVVSVLLKLAGISVHKLGDIHRGAKLYQKVVQMQPDNRRALHQLVELYSSARMWGEVIALILRIAELEDEPFRRGKYLQAAGTVARHHVNPESAQAYLDRALDCFFGEKAPQLRADDRAGAMKAFRDIVGMFAERSDWKTVERTYRRMLMRLGPGDPEIAVLWSELGAIYREHLGQRDAAIHSFEVASSLEAESVTHQRILVDLYESAGGNHLDKAIEGRYRLLQSEPFAAQHYKALRNLFVRTGQLDAAWCACRALVFLGAADEGEEAYFRQSAHGVVWPKLPIDEKMWARLRHPGEDLHISHMMGFISEAVALEVAIHCGDLDLSSDTSPHFHPLRQMYAAVGQSIGIPHVPGLVQPQRPEGILLANTERDKKLRSAFVIGRSAYQGKTAPGIVYGFARHLAYARRSYYLRLALPAEEELAAALYAAAKLSHTWVQIPEVLAPTAKRFQKALTKHLRPMWREKLAATTEAFLRAGHAFDVGRWGRAVDMTARRVGLLLAGDLEAAALAMNDEPALAGQLDHRSRIGDLLLHSVSAEHLSLRRDLRIDIRPAG